MIDYCECQYAYHLSFEVPEMTRVSRYHSACYLSSSIAFSTFINLEKSISFSLRTDFTLISTDYSSMANLFLSSVSSLLSFLRFSLSSLSESTISDIEASCFLRTSNNLAESLLIYEVNKISNNIHFDDGLFYYHQLLNYMVVFLPSQFVQLPQLPVLSC